MLPLMIYIKTHRKYLMRKLSETSVYKAINLVPRSPAVIRKGDLVKFDFEIRAFLSLRMFVLFVVILGHFAE